MTAVAPRPESAIDTTGIPRPVLIKAFYDAARPLGMGFLNASPGGMDLKEAEDIAASPDKRGRIYLDYYKGRCIKTDFGDGWVEARLFDRDYGPGAAQRIVDDVRAKTGGAK